MTTHMFFLSFTFTVSDGTNQQFMISEEDDVTRTTDPQVRCVELYVCFFVGFIVINRSSCVICKMNNYRGR